MLQERGLFGVGVGVEVGVGVAVTEGVGLCDCDGLGVGSAAIAPDAGKTAITRAAETKVSELLRIA